MGVKSHPLHQVWRGMVRRCHSPTATGYKNYGGRGISVCERWRYSFLAFVEDMPPRPSPEHSIDRHPDNDGNYEPGNVRWATKPEQSHNMRNNINVTSGGRTQTVPEWAKETGISRRTIRNRLQRGWSGEDAVKATPQKHLTDNTFMPPGGRAECAALGLHAGTVLSRLRYGWSYEKALTAPIDHSKASKSRRSPTG